MPRHRNILSVKKLHNPIIIFQSHRTKPTNHRQQQTIHKHIFELKIIDEINRWDSAQSTNIHQPTIRPNLPRTKKIKFIQKKKHIDLICSLGIEETLSLFNVYRERECLPMEQRINLWLCSETIMSDN